MKTYQFLKMISADKTKLTQFADEELERHLREVQRMLFVKIVDAPRQRTCLELAYDALYICTNSPSAAMDTNAVLIAIARAWNYLHGFAQKSEPPEEWISLVELCYRIALRFKNESLHNLCLLSDSTKLLLIAAHLEKKED